MGCHSINAQLHCLFLQSFLDSYIKLLTVSSAYHYFLINCDYRIHTDALLFIYITKLEDIGFGQTHSSHIGDNKSVKRDYDSSKTSHLEDRNMHEYFLSKSRVLEADGTGLGSVMVILRVSIGREPLTYSHYDKYNKCH